jgi:peptidoglycan hydrolase-like protein with peptidoglycan-binding domain
MVFKKGMIGTEIQKIQKILIALGYDLGSSGADGKFGPVTEAAVKAFQDDNNLTVDGIVGPETLTKLIEKTKAIGYEVKTPNTVAKKEPSFFNWKTIGIISAVVLGIIFFLRRNNE